MLKILRDFKPVAPSPPSLPAAGHSGAVGRAPDTAKIAPAVERAPDASTKRQLPLSSPDQTDALPRPAASWGVTSSRLMSLLAEADQNVLAPISSADKPALPKSRT